MECISLNIITVSNNDNLASILRFVEQLLVVVKDIFTFFEKDLVPGLNKQK